MKKKLVALAMTAAMMASLTACGNSAAETAEETTKAEAETTKAEAAESSDASDNEFGVSDSDPEITISLAHNSGESTVIHLSCEHFKEKVEEYSQGKITVDIYPNGTLMDVKQTNEAMKDGTIEMTAGSITSSISTSLGIMELPNLVNSEEECHELVQPGTDFRNLLDSLMEEVNFHIVTLEPCNFRMLTSNVEVRSFEDLQGLNIRVMDNTVPMSYWKQWGANPTPINWSETYISIQQGLVDAQENPYDSIISANLFEVQKYLVATNHVMFYTGIYMGNEFYNSLPDSYKAIVDKAGEETAAFAYETAQATSAEKLALLQDKGMEFIDFSDADYEKMRANASDADAIVKESVGEDVFNKAMAALGY